MHSTPTRFLALSLLLAAAGCQSDGPLVSAEANTWIDLVGADDANLHYVRGDHGGLFALGADGDSRLLIDGVGASEGATVTARGDDALYVVDDGTLWQAPDGGGDATVVADELGAVLAIAVDGDTVYLGNDDEIRTLSLVTGEVSTIDWDGVRPGGRLGVFDGRMVWSSRTDLRSRDLTTGAEQVMYAGLDGRRFVAGGIDLVGSVDGEILFVDGDAAELYAVRFYGRAVVTSFLVEDVVAATLSGDQVVAVDSSGRVLTVDVASHDAAWVDARIDVEGDGAAELYSTASQLVYQRGDEILGVDLP